MINGVTDRSLLNTLYPDVDRFETPNFREDLLPIAKLACFC